VPGARMHDETGRLRHYDPRRRRNSGRRSRCSRRVRGARPPPAPRAPRSRCPQRACGSCSPRFPSMTIAARSQQHLHVGPAPARDQRDRSVDPLPREHGRNHDRFTADAHLCGSGTARGARSERKISSTAAPIVTHESATLNTGHHPTDTKVDDCGRAGIRERGRSGRSGSRAHRRARASTRPRARRRSSFATRVRARTSRRSRRPRAGSSCPGTG